MFAATNRSVLTRKLGIDDGANKFTSVATINDPSNKNTANQNV